MPIARRTFLKLVGGLGVSGAGYAGYTEATDGTWLYDPAQLTAARNKFFGLVDYATLRTVAEEYGTGAQPASGLELIDTSEIEQMAVVGSTSISGDNGVPTALVSGAVDGSFDVDDLHSRAEQADQLNEVETDGDNRFQGYRLWEASLPQGAGPAAGAPSSLPETTALGTKTGTIVGGTVRAPDSDEATSMASVKTMIRSEKTGGGVTGPAPLRADADYASIRDEFSSNPTFLFGAMVDPALVTLTTAIYQIALSTVGGLAGPAGGAAADAASVVIEEWIADLRAGAVGADINTAGSSGGSGTPTTSVKVFLTYSTADAAKQTGIVQLFNAATASANLDGLKEVNARYQGKSIVVTATGETEELLEQSIDTARAGLEQTSLATLTSGIE